MRKLFFALAFMLVGTFAFGNNAVVETIDENANIENVINLEKNSTNEVLLREYGICSITVTTTYYWSDGSVTQTSNTYHVYASSESHCDAITESWNNMFN